MRPVDAIKALKVLTSINHPVMLHGSPGVGKSDVVRQVAADANIKLIDVRLSQLDPVDLRGVPSVVDGKTTWNQPDFLPTRGKGILFLDEINSAAQATQAAAYQLVLDRQLGDYTLPKGWKIVAAGNRASDKAIVNQMSTALKNRLAHIEYEVDTDDWCDWAIKANISSEVLGFIRFRPALLNQFDDLVSDKSVNIKDINAFATPRSWQRVSEVIETKPDKDIEFSLYAGIIGEGPATEFLAYLKYYRNLPDFNRILLNPTKEPVPTEPAALYATAAGLGTKVTQDNIGTLIKYVMRLPAEFQVLLMKDACTRDPSIAETDTFANVWIPENRQYLT